MVDGKLMTAENVNQIFNNIEMILQLNEMEVFVQLKKIKETWNDQTTVLGPSFIKWVHSFRN